MCLPADGQDKGTPGPSVCTNDPGVPLLVRKEVQVRHKRRRCPRPDSNRLRAIRPERGRGGCFSGQCLVGAVGNPPGDGLAVGIAGEVLPLDGVAELVVLEMSAVVDVGSVAVQADLDASPGTASPVLDLEDDYSYWSFWPRKVLCQQDGKGDVGCDPRFGGQTLHPPVCDFSAHAPCYAFSAVFLVRGRFEGRFIRKIVRLFLYIFFSSLKI